MHQKNELTGKPALMKELNIGLIKDALEKHHTATRVELSAITQISQPTVNVLIKQLLEENIVISLGSAKSTGGRKAEIYALNNKRSSIVSLIVQGNCFEYVVTDMELNEGYSGRAERDKTVSYKEQVCAIIKDILSKNQYVKAIAIGVPGAVTTSGEVFDIPQIPEWEHVNVRQFIEKECLLPVKVMNDINAIAVGYSGDVTTGADNMVYLHLGSDGIGAGIIVDRKLYPGCKCFSGEIGHMRLDGRATVEEQLESQTGIEERTEIYEKIITNFICILNPEQIVIGGDISADMYRNIKEGCLQRLPVEIMPQFEQIDDVYYYYLKGLGKKGKELLDKDIRLA